MDTVGRILGRILAIIYVVRIIFVLGIHIVIEIIIIVSLINEIWRIVLGIINGMCNMAVDVMYSTQFKLNERSPCTTRKPTWQLQRDRRGQEYLRIETPLETALALRFSVQRCKLFFGGSCSGNILSPLSSIKSRARW